MPTPSPPRRATIAQVIHCVGGVISPLLANVALHVLDAEWARTASKLGMLVRYADDFIVLCASRTRADQARRRVGEILAGLGLQLHPDKTRIACLTRYPPIGAPSQPLRPRNDHWPPCRCAIGPFYCALSTEAQSMNRFRRRFLFFITDFERFNQVADGSRDCGSRSCLPSQTLCLRGRGRNP